MTEELQIPDKVKKVYEWCSQLTAESRKNLDSYVWPDEMKSLANRLILAKGALIAVKGYSGTGKSSALKVFEQALTQAHIKSVSFKLVGRNLVKSFSGSYPKLASGMFTQAIETREDGDKAQKLRIKL